MNNIFMLTEDIHSVYDLQDLDIVSGGRIDIDYISHDSKSNFLPCCWKCLEIRYVMDELVFSVTVFLKLGHKDNIIMLEPHPIFGGKYSIVHLHMHSIPIYRNYFP